MKNQIIKLLKEKDYLAIKKILAELHDADIAELLEELKEGHLIIVFRLLQKDTVEVFSHLSSITQEKIINTITDKEMSYLVNELYFDDMIDLLEEMPALIVKRILKNVREEERSLVNQFLKYPENSAGSLMTIEFVDLKRTDTVKKL